MKERRRAHIRAQELCEQGGGPNLSFPIPFLPSLISHVVSVDVKHHERRKDTELRSCVKVEVAALGSRP